MYFLVFILNIYIFKKIWNTEVGWGTVTGIRHYSPQTIVFNFSNNDKYLPWKNDSKQSFSLSYLKIKCVHSYYYNCPAF